VWVGGHRHATATWLVAVGYITFKTNRPMETFVNNEIGGACSTYVGEERGVQGFDGEI
jgi:hypothetical protein